MGNWLQIWASLVTSRALKPTTSSTMLLTEKSICHYSFIKKPLKKFQRTVAGCHADSPARPSLMSTQFYPTAHSSFKSGQQSKEPGNYSAAACVTFFLFTSQMLRSLRACLKSFPLSEGSCFLSEKNETHIE